MSIGESSVGEYGVGEAHTGGAIADVAGIGFALAVGDAEAFGGATADPDGIAMVLAFDPAEGLGGADVDVDGIAFAVATGGVDVVIVTPAFYTLVLRPDGAGQYLAEVSMVPSGNAGGVSGGTGGAVGELAVGEAPFGSSLDIGEATVLYSDRDWVGAPDDEDKPNAYYDGRLMVPLTIERSVPLLPEEPRRSARQYGYLEWANDDGDWDDLASKRSVDGRNVSVLYGPVGGAYQDFQVIANLLGDTISLTENNVRVTLRDKAQPLDRLLQRETYDGTGGIDGNADLEGIAKPFAIGAPDRVTMQMIDPYYLVYQAHFTAVEGFRDVSDMGVPLDLDTAAGTGGDVANWAALIGATVASGDYITCNALGVVRLGASPVGTITANVDGDKTDGTYVSTLRDIAWSIATVHGDVPVASANKTTFDALPNYECGYYLSPDDASRITAADALAEVLASVGAYWDISKRGTLRVNQHSDPITQPYTRWVDAADILSVLPEASPRIRWRNPVGYARNWTIQSGADLASSVSDDDRQTWSAEQRVAGKSVEDANIKLRQPNALDPSPLRSILTSETDAEAVAADQMALHGVPRNIVTLVMPRIGYLDDLGDVLSVTYPRYGLSQRRNVRIIGQRIDADRDEVMVRVWF